MLRIDPRDALPIWRQIEEGVRRLVGAGGMRPGRPLPSVRDLARELRVNPMTVSKAYQRLTDAGVLVVKRGEGTFVADEPPQLTRAERGRALREGALRYVSLAVTLGISRAEAEREIGAAWDGATRSRGGQR
ncbi:MAG TPA: GntR family transcriptional regulator [Vicinamibacteria bacterium]|nr:GntR family transcriptional regulator [Vicinamibacteria bacterium]